MAKALEGFEPLFGEAQPEWSTTIPPSDKPFLFFVDALADPLRLRLQVSDFHSNTFETVRSILQLEDLRDAVGIGGSWEDFIDYLKSSLSSGNVKLVLEVPTKSGNVNGATFASLTAQKLKGMPRISLSLEKLVGSASNDAMGNITMLLYRAFKNRSEDFVEEQGRRYNLSTILEAERDKNKKIQDQLDAFAFSRKRKDHKTTTSESPVMEFDPMKVSERQLSSDTLNNPNPPIQSPKATHRAAAPDYRRIVKARGVKLQSDVIDNID